MVKKVCRSLLIAVPFVWLGMVLGISFLEAPLKFQAPGVTLSLGLGIGRIVFAALNRSEIVFAVILAVSAFWGKPSHVSKGFLFVLAVILLLQAVWLLPALDVRAELIISGKTPEASWFHITYIIAEICKAVCLLVFGFLNISSQERTSEG